MKKAKLSLALSVVALAALASGPAAAWEARYSKQISIHNDVRQNGRDILENRDVLRDEMDQTRQAIVNALRMQTGEQSAYQDKTIESARRIADAEQQNASERLRQEFRARAESGAMDPSPDLCLLADAFNSGGPEAGPGAVGTTTAADVQSKLSGADPAVVEGGTTLARSFVDDRRNLANAFGRSDATVDPSILSDASIDLSDPRDQAAFARLMRNMVDPFPERPVTAREMQTPEGVARAARQGAKRTKVNANLALTGMVANMNDEVIDRTETWDAFLEDLSAYNRDVGDRLSEMEQLEIRILRDYAPSKDRYAKRATLNERGLLQQLIEQVSLNNRMMYISLELDARRGLVESQILTSLMD